MLEGGDGEAAVFELLDAEWENMQVALDWAHESAEPELEGRIAVGLRWWWLVRGRLGEAVHIFERIVAASVGLPATHAEALSGAAIFHYRRGDRVRGTTELEAARALFAELGNDDEEARCLAELGAIAHDDGDLSLAAERFRAVADVFERIGNDYRLGVVLANLAEIEVQRGDLEAAAGYSSRAIELQRAVEDRGGLGVSLANLGRARLRSEGVEAARPALREALELALQLDYRILIAYLLDTAGELAAADGDSEQAVRLIGAGAALFASMGMETPPEEIVEVERVLGPLRESLGDGQVDELLADGREAPLDAMIAAARELI
jgi:tetratricopeptide (TPR) repeat protein